MGIYADELKKVLETNEVRQCSCCGGPVIVKGKTTKFYIPVDVKILGQDELTGNIRISRIATLPGDPNNPGQDWHAQKPSDLKLS